MKFFRNKHFRFTLIEIVVALALLTMSVTGLLQLAMQSQLRLARGIEKWHRTHMLLEGAEYLLLQRSEKELTVPDEFFEYSDYQINAEVEELDDTELPEELIGLEGQLPLRTLKVELVSVASQEVLESIYIDRISFEEGEEETTKANTGTGGAAN